MTQVSFDTPFHAGETHAQKQAGVGDIAAWAGGFIRDHMPEQHRDFHSSLPFLVLSGMDVGGRTWVTLVEGPEGFVRSPDPRRLTLNTQIDPQDPLAEAFATGTDVGMIGIELSTRRRNRLSGRISPSEVGLTLDVRQTFGNCPQYIHDRRYRRVADHRPEPVIAGNILSPTQIALIQNSDTMFIGSGHQHGEDTASRGYDASHRGGAPGFVRVDSPTRLRLPDYAGNNFFNTIGNLLVDPRVGLVFVEFETGRLLHITGRARIDWEPRSEDDPDALRFVEIEIDAVLDRPAALSLRWARQDHRMRRFRIARKEAETPNVTSFYLAPADGQPVAPFQAGQHIPIELQLPERDDPVTRNYSLSGPPDEAGFYRISVKREDHGLASRFLHDGMQESDTLMAGEPAGEFVLPDGDTPLVLISAGVGVTPMRPLLQAALGGSTTRQVAVLHGARNGADHALRDEMQALVDAHPNATQAVFYSQPAPDDTGHRVGRMTARDVLDLGMGAEAHYMLCGPAAFLSELTQGLQAAGVPASQIHFETFGPSAA